MIVFTKDKVVLPDNAPYEDIEDALITADKKGWHRQDVMTVEEKMQKTSLDHKCGSCEYFVPTPMCGSRCYGVCKALHAPGARTRRACKDYKKKEAM